MIRDLRDNHYVACGITLTHADVVKLRAITKQGELVQAEFGQTQRYPNWLDVLKDHPSNTLGAPAQADFDLQRLENVLAAVRLAAGAANNTATIRFTPQNSLLVVSQGPLIKATGLLMALHT